MPSFPHEIYMASSSLRITHVQGIFSPEHGGPCFSLANYCRGQVARGHQVSLRVLEGYPGTSPALRLELPVDMQVRPVDPPTRLGASAGLKRLLAADPTPDIYHLHGVWLRAMHYGAVEARRRGRPYVVELMGAYEKHPLRQKWLVKWISRHWFQDALLRRAGCLHVNSLHEARALRELGFRVPIAVIPVGVDTGAIDADDVGEAVPASLGGLGDQPFVLYLARIHPKKGIEMLLRAWAGLQRRFPAHRLVIAGSGDKDYLAACERLAEELRLGESCVWCGQVDDAEKSWLYRHADIYVLPSYSENFGNTVVEALAHATPVVTTVHTPWTGLPEQGCGWIAETNVDALSATLETALDTSKPELERMGDAGRRWVAQHYSLTSVIGQIDRVYAWLLGGVKPDDLLAP